MGGGKCGAGLPPAEIPNDKGPNPPPNENGWQQSANLRPTCDDFQGREAKPAGPLEWAPLRFERAQLRRLKSRWRLVFGVWDFSEL